jgi:hypothetical protein
MLIGMVAVMVARVRECWRKIAMAMITPMEKNTGNTRCQSIVIIAAFPSRCNDNAAGSL